MTTKVAHKGSHLMNGSVKFHLGKERRENPEATETKEHERGAQTKQPSDESVTIHLEL